MKPWETSVSTFAEIFAYLDIPRHRADEIKKRDRGGYWVMGKHNLLGPYGSAAQARAARQFMYEEYTRHGMTHF